MTAAARPPAAPRERVICRPDVLLIGAEELENLGTRSLAAVLRRHGYSVELAAFSSADDMPSVLP